jgi:hypothetical protein
MERPWTVYALVALWFVGLVLSWFVDTSFGIGDPANSPDLPIWVSIVSLLISVGIGLGLWMGKTWAYSLAFVLTGLSAFALVMAVAFGDFTVWAVVQVAASLFLLLHPATRRFAGRRRSAPVETT